jgi:hypothetical protein
MTLSKFLILSSFLVLPGAVQAELYLVDQVECVVCGPAANKPFTDTEVTWKRTLENQFVPLQKQIQAEIVAQQVATEKMPIDPEAIEKYVTTIKKQNHINDAQMEQMFEETGRTMQEGIAMLGAQYTSEFFNHYKFKSQLVPTDDEINEYFNEYPEFVDGFYEIKIARVGYDANNHDEIKKQVEEFIQNDAVDHATIFWGNPVKISAEDLAAEQKFVTEMQPGQIEVKETETCFELVKLISMEPTRLKTLDECRGAIIEILNRKKMESMVQAYNEATKDAVDIIQFN